MAAVRDLRTNPLLRSDMNFRIFHFRELHIRYSFKAVSFCRLVYVSFPILFHNFQNLKSINNPSSFTDAPFRAPLATKDRVHDDTSSALLNWSSDSTEIIFPAYNLKKHQRD